MVMLRALRAVAVFFVVFCFGLGSAAAGKPHDGRLVLALEAGDAIAVTKALKQGASMNGLLEHPEYPSIKKTALQWLLNFGSSDEAPAALESKRLEIAKILFANGAKLSGHQDEVFATIVYGHELVMRLLLDHGAKTTDKVYGYTPLQLAYLNQQPKIQELLLSRGSVPIAENERLQIDIVRGAKHHDPKLIEEALRAGANINAPDPSGETGLTALLGVPLVYMDRGMGLLVKFLVEWKANPAIGSSTDRPSFPIIQWVEMNSFREEDFELTALILEEFVLRGADVNAVNQFKATALHAAAKHGNVPACRVLLKAGAKPSSADFQNRTPMSVAKNAATRAVLRGSQ
jgi:ankyrin repeat protein